jgi:hypothetical protein
MPDSCCGSLRLHTFSPISLLRSVARFVRIDSDGSFPSERSDMQGETKERWKVLCEQATTEQDPVKLLKLITQINELLLTKEGRLLKEKVPHEPDSDQSST